MPPWTDLTWTNFANGVLVIFLGLITAVGARFGLKQANSTPNPPAVVNAVMIEQELLKQLVDSLKSTCKMMEQLKGEVSVNNTQLTLNTRKLQEIMEQSDRLGREVRDLTYEIERKKG
jgi:hypothetical protein